MAHRFLVLNGPNLNLLGTREKSVYGSDTLENIINELHVYAQQRDVELRDF